MKNLFTIVCTMLLVAVQFSFTTVTDKMDCSMLHSGTFTYSDDDGDEVVVVIEGENHTEYHKNKKYVVESKIKWVNDCEFNATLGKATLPGFPFSKGAVMNFKVDSIKENFIYYTATIMGQSIKGTFKKQGVEGTNSK